VRVLAGTHVAVATTRSIHGFAPHTTLNSAITVTWRLLPQCSDCLSAALLLCVSQCCSLVVCLSVLLSCCVSLSAALLLCVSQCCSLDVCLSVLLSCCVSLSAALLLCVSQCCSLVVCLSVLLSCCVSLSAALLLCVSQCCSLAVCLSVLLSCCVSLSAALLLWQPHLAPIWLSMPHPGLTVNTTLAQPLCCCLIVCNEGESPGIQQRKQRWQQSKPKRT
jgi:hypothetical protein